MLSNKNLRRAIGTVLAFSSANEANMRHQNTQRYKLFKCPWPYVAVVVDGIVLWGPHSLLSPFPLSMLWLFLALAPKSLEDPEIVAFTLHLC